MTKAVYEAKCALPNSFFDPDPMLNKALVSWLHIPNKNDGGDYWRMVIDRTRELLKELDWCSLYGLSARKVSERDAPRAQEEFEDAWQLAEALNLSLSEG
jgi:hypothetical protein